MARARNLQPLTPATHDGRDLPKAGAGEALAIAQQLQHKIEEIRRAVDDSLNQLTEIAKMLTWARQAESQRVETQPSLAGDGKDKETVPIGSKLLYSRREAAAVLSVSIRTLDQFIYLKELPCRRMGGRVLIPRPALEAFARRDHPTADRRSRKEADHDRSHT